MHLQAGTFFALPPSFFRSFEGHLSQVLTAFFTEALTFFRLFRTRDMGMKRGFFPLRLRARYEKSEKRACMLENSILIHDLSAMASAKKVDPQSEKSLLTRVFTPCTAE